jgi:hypothetical protein
VASPQQVAVTVGGGAGLAGKTVHVWASDFDFGTGSPSTWFAAQPDIHPSGGTFALTVQPGWVYSLTTTTGQGRTVDTAPGASDLVLPYQDSLTTSGNAGTADDEPALLAAQDGAFELAPCAVPDGTATICTAQQAVGPPIFWHKPTVTARYPYATLGEASWAQYSDLLVAP